MKFLYQMHWAETAFRAEWHWERDKPDCAEPNDTREQRPSRRLRVWAQPATLRRDRRESSCEGSSVDFVSPALPTML